MAERSWDTLFARLMLAQALAILLIVASFLGTRMEVTAQPYAQLWAVNLVEAVRQPPGAALLPASPGFPVQRQANLPDGFKSFNLIVGPGVRRWQSEFAARGLAFDDLRVVRNAGVTQLWIHAVQPGVDPVWLVLPAPQLLRLMSVQGPPLELLLILAIIGLSWLFTRHVTRPLQELSRLMRSDVLSLDTKSVLSSATPSTVAGASVEIREIEHDFRQLLERLRLAELERALLLAGVSHDLRSPLARIRLATELLPLRADPEPHLAAITRNIDHADRLIGSFLDFVRAGALEMGETVDVAAVVGAVVARFACAPEELRVVCAPARAQLSAANALLVERLVFNLVDNALVHGKAPVAVRVFSVPGAAGMQTVEVDVCDAGDGLPAGREAAMLQAFARGDPGRGRPGSGLGLSIVRQAVARMGGTLVFTRDASGHHARVQFVRTAAAPMGTEKMEAS